MTQKGMCTESASAETDRMCRYKRFAEAFSYPEEETLAMEYDRLFRAKEIWLYGVEHLAKNEFQRVNILSDIMGFYRAFGVEPDRERPDALNSELEFMYYLIYKGLHSKEKRDICIDAQKKFFNEHLYPAAIKIANRITSESDSNYYKKLSEDLLEFLEQEK